MSYARAVAIVGLLALALAACAGEPAPPAEPVAEQVSPEEQARLQEQANMALVDEWWRTILMAGHSERAAEFMAEDYIQHNPNINTGRAGLLATPFMQREPRDIPADIMPAPVVRFAKGDYVVFVWEREGKDAQGAPYTYNFFDVVRVQDGKVQEHWDSVWKTSTDLVDTGIGPRPMAPANTPDEQANEDLANRLFKDILQYGRLELADEVMAEGYIQHNPNVPTGRAGFVEFFQPFARPEPVQDAWKTEPELILTNDDIVFYMFARYSADPADPSRAYKWNWFDMVRVDDGLVQEHWDMATKDQPPAAVEPPADFVAYR
ncbi:MAG: SnoaL-like domain-containing protein [Acidobacteria bacterium]|nr:SnoaL-like domain-containing protein [Acidobacteriota bacterium]